LRWEKARTGPFSTAIMIFHMKSGLARRHSHTTTIALFGLTGLARGDARFRTKADTLFA
jgi:hypothetical protein